ncbi:hypothetical protein SCUP234_00027 [Seiridium cupressi]
MFKYLYQASLVLSFISSRARPCRAECLAFYLGYVPACIAGILKVRRRYPNARPDHTSPRTSPESASQNAMATTSIQSILTKFKVNHLPHDRQSYIYLAVAAVGGINLLAYWISTYRGWRALGRGGLPPNPLGWLAQACLRPGSRSDVRAPAPWTLEQTEASWGAVGRKSFFTNGKAPPPRAGARPEVPTYVAPQRQMTEQSDPAMLERMESYLAALALRNPAMFQLKPSGLEGPFRNAVWLADHLDIPAYLKGTRGECIHPHDEGSTHLVLGLSDATRAIELGWAERHKLSGAYSEVLPWGYVLIYAPRDGPEFEVWKQFVLAAARCNAEATVNASGSDVVAPSA